MGLAILPGRIKPVLDDVFDFARRIDGPADTAADLAFYRQFLITPERWRPGVPISTAQLQEWHPDFEFVPLADIRSSQASASFRTDVRSRGEAPNINLMVIDLQTRGWDLTNERPIIVVERSDGIYQSLDHRRLVAAHRADWDEVPVTVKSAGTEITEEQADERLLRLTADNVRYPERLERLSELVGRPVDIDDVPETWGEAIWFRAAMSFEKDFPLEGIPISDVRIRGEPTQ